MKSRIWMSALLLLTIASVSGCRKQAEAAKAGPLLASYDSEPDWTDAQHVIPLSYQQAQGKRIFLPRLCLVPRRRDSGRSFQSLEPDPSSALVE